VSGLRFAASTDRRGCRTPHR